MTNNQQKSLPMLSQIYDRLESGEFMIEEDEVHSFYLNISDRSRNVSTTWTTGELLRQYYNYIDNTSTTDMVHF